MKPASILITDDESNIRMLLRTALESEGYNVEEACDGRQALEAVRRAPPDLMVLDLNMPVLDGMAVLEQMKLLTAQLKPRVIVLTAYGSIPAAVRATQLGAADFLEKPVTPAELRKTVRGVLDEPVPDQELVPAELPGEYRTALDKVRKSMRLAQLETAESLLMKVAERREQQSAEYFNLLGVLYESQRRWRLARKCFCKAIDGDPHYEPAKKNIQRLAEMQSYGRSQQPIYLGDEGEDEWCFQPPPFPH